jgi:hypothetical protein
LEIAQGRLKPAHDFSAHFFKIGLPHPVHLRIRLRAVRGLTQEALAYDCGMNRTYLSGIERAERNVSIDNVAWIAKGLKVEPWKLLKDD